METKCYKIRNKDGLFSTGGSCPRWSKRGKAWSNIGHVRCHLGHLYRNDVYGPDAEILEFILTENVKSYLNVKQEMTNIHNRKIDEEKRNRDFLEYIKQENEKKELERLKAKYEGDKK